MCHHWLTRAHRGRQHARRLGRCESSPAQTTAAIPTPADQCSEGPQPIPRPPGDIFLGEDVVVEPGALVRGPAYIGAGCLLRHGAYIRQDVVLGERCVVGGELKHVLALGDGELPHHGYVGDSLLGFRAHFGCGAVAANLPLFEKSSIPIPILVEATDGGGRGMVNYLLGRRKFGAVVGDGSQLGCGVVTEPGCLLAPQTHAYPLCRLPRGCYGPREILKNRPTVERAPLTGSYAYADGGVLVGTWEEDELAPLGSPRLDSPQSRRQMERSAELDAVARALRRNAAAARRSSGGGFI